MVSLFVKIRLIRLILAAVVLVVVKLALAAV